MQNLNFYQQTENDLDSWASFLWDVVSPKNSLENHSQILPGGNHVRADREHKDLKCDTRNNFSITEIDLHARI